MSKGSHNSTLLNLGWKFAERFSAQLVSFVVSIILARLLDPSDYGTIAIVNIFITMANVFVSDGLGTALIQKKEADNLDFSSVLYFNVVMSAALYIILFFAAPYIAFFYGNDYDILVPTLRVMGIRLIIAAINSVQQAYVSKKMIFKKFFVATLIGTIVSALVGIWMAYHGYGVWALVAQYITNSTIDTIVLYLSLRYFPGFGFSFSRIRKLISFGLANLGAGLLVATYTKIRELIVGKVYSAADLAYYNRAAQFPDLFMTNINASISAVLFPRLVLAQDNKVQVKVLMQKFIKLSTYILAPMLIGLAAVSKTIVVVLLTEKWMPCVVFLQFFCLNHVFRPMHTANIQALRAIGRNDIVLKLEIVKKSIELISLLLVMNISVKAIVINMVVMSFIFTGVNAYPVKKILDYSVKEQFCDVFPTLLMCGVMYVGVNSLNFVNFNIYLKLFAQITVGILIYWILSLVTKNKDYRSILEIAKSFHDKQTT